MNIRSLLLASLALLFSTVCVVAGSGDPAAAEALNSWLVEVKLDDFEKEFPLYYHGEYDLAGWDKGRSVVYLVLDEKEQGTLAAKGTLLKVIRDSNPLAVDPGYFDYEEVEARLAELESNYPLIAARVDLNDELGTPLTYEGRTIYALKISDNPLVNEDEPAIVVDGAHHARELMTPVAVMDIMDVLTQGYGTDPQVTAWVEAYEIWLVPMVNPDGLEFVFNENSMWRKNRKPDSGSAAIGVDNNRNYTAFWGQCGSTSSNPSSDTYRGPYAESEEENQTMEALFAREKPLIYVSYHSSGNEVLYPYLCGTLVEQGLYFQVRDEYASRMGFATRLASASGESFEDAYNEHGALAFLTEIGTSFQPPFSQVQPIMEGMRPGWRYLLERGLEASVQGHVTDAGTGDPLTEATVRVEEIVFAEGEQRNPEPLYGRYNRLLLPGSHTVSAGAVGYVPQSFEVTVADEALLLDVALLPGSCPDSDSDTYQNDLCGGLDCNDDDPALNPDATEVCDDGLDNDCDGRIDSDDDECGSSGWGAASVVDRGSSRGSVPLNAIALLLIPLCTWVLVRRIR